MKRSVRVGIVQKGAVHLNLEKSLQLVSQMTQEAAKGGAELVVFGETWLSGYPAWIDHCPEVALWGNEATRKAYSLMYKSSVNIEGDQCKTLSEIARKNGVVLVIGVNEVVRSGGAKGTIFNSLLTFNSCGTLVNHHRKLMPTFNEKLLYGLGDAKGVTAVDTSCGRLGGLICWEHWMPLTRQAMHNSGEDLHIAVWPQVNDKHQLASRHYAFEGRCFVIAAGQIMRVKDIPEVFTLPEAFKENPDQMILKGGSCVIGPDGDFILEPQFDKEGVIFCDIDNFDSLIEERLTLDTSGHYSRPELFSLNVIKDRLV